VNRRNQKKPKKTSLQKPVGEIANSPNKVTATVTPEIQQKQQAVLAEAHFFRGPIPHPAVLAQYNSVLPDAANRIIGMAERQETHRQTMERHVIEEDMKRSKLGLWLGFVLALIFGIGAIYLLSIGKSLEGLATIFTTVGTVAGGFIIAHRLRKHERLERGKSQKPKQEEQLSFPFPS